MSKTFRGRVFYVDETFEPVLKEFDEICAREGESRSEKLREFIERYVIIHTSGNPQLRIDMFSDVVTKKACFFCQGHFERLFKVEFVSGLIAPTCEACLDRNRAKGTFSTVKKVMGIME